MDKKDLKRPITIQSHIDPVPERIMKQIITALGIGGMSSGISCGKCKSVCVDDIGSYYPRRQQYDKNGKMLDRFRIWGTLFIFTPKPTIK